MKLVTYPHWRDQTPSWGGGGGVLPVYEKVEGKFFCFYIFERVTKIDLELKNTS